MYEKPPIPGESFCKLDCIGAIEITKSYPRSRLKQNINIFIFCNVTSSSISKLIPLIITKALQGKELPVYGDGKQIRDWLYVEDHACALTLVAKNGKVGETYNIGGHNEKENIEVVNEICSILDELVPSSFEDIQSYSELIRHVEDRAGHDVRYAIDATKIHNDLNWLPNETFESGLKKTVHWYLKNLDWLESDNNQSYKGQRLGVIEL